MRRVSDFVRAQPLFAGMARTDLDFIASCGRLQRFAADAYLAREDAPAERFYLLLEGRVLLETHHNQHPPVPLQTLGAGDVLGWSWLIPPYRWHFDARALTPLRCVDLDGRCLRQKCEGDTRLGYELMKRLGQVMVARLHAARLQLLDIYSDGSGESLT